MPIYPSTTTTTFTGDICLATGGYKVGICKSSPGSPLHLEKAATNCKVRLDMYTSLDTGHTSVHHLTKSANSTIGTVSATSNGDSLGKIDIYGVNDSSPPSFVKCSGISCYQVGSAGTTYVPTRMDFITCDGSSAATERLTVAYPGVGIGTTSPTAVLDLVPGTIGNANPNIRLRGVTSTVPSAGNNGDVQVYESGGTTRLYIKMSGTWKYISLT